MPSVQRAHEAFKDQDAVMLSISIDGEGTPTVKRYVDKHGFSMPVLVDAEMKIARQFGARGVPTTIIVDRQGKMVASGNGPVDFDAPAFRGYIQTLLSASPGG
jgi:peroxiredoxin